MQNQHRRGENGVRVLCSEPDQAFPIVQVHQSVVFRPAAGIYSACLSRGSLASNRYFNPLNPLPALPFPQSSMFLTIEKGTGESTCSNTRESVCAATRIP